MQAKQTQARTTAELAGTARAIWAPLLAGLDRCAHGMALLDADARPWFANASARFLLKRMGPQESDRPPCSHWQHTWCAALRRVCGLGRRELVEVPLQQSTLSIALVPVPMQGAQLAFALFGREELCGPVELQQFALHHHLTAAETLVLGLLCKGLAAKDIAHAHGVARTTVVTQITAIRAKTDCASVRALLDMVSRMPQLAPVLCSVHPLGPCRH